MNKKIVAVVFGGHSSEHEISKISAATIVAAIPEDKYFVMPVYITKEGKWFLYDGPKENIKNIQWEKFGTPVALSPDTGHKGLLRLVGDKYKTIPVDIVFPVLHGINGEDGSIQGLCELAGIPYVGCGVLSSAICMDKAFTKIIVKAIGIRQAEHIVVKADELDENLNGITKNIRYKIGYPCFVKPANAGSSMGVSRAENKKELEAALRLAAKHDRKVIVEKMIRGRELECAVLGNDKPEVSPVGEIVAAADFYDFDAKYNNAESQTLIPADIPEEVAEEIRAAALEIYKACDCAGMARIDFFLENETNKVVFNELNTIPGFTSISMYPMLWKENGVPVGELVDRLIAFALERHE